MTRARRKIVLLVLPAAALLLPAGFAAAQSTSSQLIVSGVSSGKILAEANIPFRMAGQLTVTFHGDATSGCAAYGLCPYSGTVVVRPTSGELILLTVRRHHHVVHTAEMFITPSFNGFLTVADVQRAASGQPGGTCADGESNGIGGEASVSGGQVTIRVLTPGGTLLSTRCAGPLDGDLATVSPWATIPFRAAARGRRTIDLGGSRAFAGHGFAGTVSSTLVLTLGARQRNSSAPVFPPGIKTTRIRTVTERLSIVRANGSLGASIQGTVDPVECRLLDSCGVTGTESITLASRPAFAQVIATGPASRPYSDFLAAVRDGPASMRRGILTEMIVTWGAGSVSTDLTQPQACTDTAPLTGASLSLSLSGDRLAGSAGANALRTRCPGPMIGGQTSPWPATAPARALRHRAFTIEAGPGGQPHADDGYTFSLDGHLSVTLRSGRISQTVSLAPAGAIPG
jgi:hypothetical protein